MISALRPTLLAFSQFVRTPTLGRRVAGLLALADTAVPLVFGAHWAEAVPAVQGLAVIGLLAGVCVVQSSLILAQGKAQLWFWYPGIVQISLLPLIGVLAGQGLAVLMAGLVIHRLLLWPISVVMALRLLRMRDYARPMLPAVAGSALMGAGIVALPQVWPLTGVGLLAVQIGAAAVVYLGWRLVCHGHGRGGCWHCCATGRHRGPDARGA